MKNTYGRSTAVGRLVFGLDQLLHHVTYVVMAAIVTGVWRTRNILPREPGRGIAGVGLILSAFKKDGAFVDGLIDLDGDFRAHFGRADVFSFHLH